MRIPVVFLTLLMVVFPLFGAEKVAREMIAHVHWLGHSAFRIAGSRIIYLDPYQINRGAVADYILITHAHADHCSPDDVRKVQGRGAIQNSAAGKDRSGHQRKEQVTLFALVSRGETGRGLQIHI